MEQWLLHFSYAGILLVILASGAGLPLPEELPLLVAGALCARGLADVWVMGPMCLTAVVGADVMLYWLGRRYGHHVPQLPLLRRFLTPAHLARAERAFHEHGGKTLLVVRFLPGIRTPVLFTAGIFRIPFWKVLLVDGGAAAVTVPVVMALGWVFGNHIAAIVQRLLEVKLAAGGVLVALGALALGVRWVRRRRVASSRQ